MHLLGDLIDRRPALPGQSSCEVALAVFVKDPDCRALAVVEGTSPIGLLQRGAFLVQMEAPGAPDRLLRDAVEPDPLIAEAEEAVTDFLERHRTERPAALLGGFIVCRDGVYEGVCDLVGLLPALVGARVDEGLVQRICAEVREPIAHALASAEGLRKLRLPENAVAHLETIADAAHSTLSLLDIAAELQKADAGRLEVRPAARRLQELMDDIEARWRDQAETSGVTLLVSYDGAPECAAMIDAPRLMQIFDALIGHAIAHSGRGVIEASLQVRSANAGFAVTGRVRDNGAAYPPDYLRTMFCGRPDGSFTGGVGAQLKLMLAWRAISAMGGTIEAKANPGAGATVSFELTAEAADLEGARSAQIEVASPQRSAHILVVDDNATNRMVVEALCEMFDCSTESVVDGVEAVEAAKAGRFDVILMDIKMPRMDGVTAAREIRKLQAPAGRVPIIALTANADIDEVAQYLAAGMKCVVEKPIKPERLMEALDGALADRNGQPGVAAA
jgi:CheY-like chemotaxis protein/signal transduction histidine kinase